MSLIWSRQLSHLFLSPKNCFRPSTYVVLSLRKKITSLIGIIVIEDGMRCWRGKISATKYKITLLQMTVLKRQEKRRRHQETPEKVKMKVSQCPMACDFVRSKNKRKHRRKLGEFDAFAELEFLLLIVLAKTSFLFIFSLFFLPQKNLLGTPRTCSFSFEWTTERGCL